MRIDENALVWHEVEATPATLAEIFRDKQVLSCEPVQIPAPDGARDSECQILIAVRKFPVYAKFTCFSNFLPLCILCIFSATFLRKLSREKLARNLHFLHVTNVLLLFQKFLSCKNDVMVTSNI